MKATEQLKAEHEGIGIMLRVVDAMCDELEADRFLNAEQFFKIIEFFKVFVDRCHHGKEEDLLFPAMESAGLPGAGGLIEQMLFEHRQGREYVRAMYDALTRYRAGAEKAEAELYTQARGYTALLRQHIDKENTEVFPLADAVLSVERQEAMFVEFEELEEKKIGKGVHEQFHQLLDNLARAYPGDRQV